MASNKGTISLPLQHVKRGRGVPGYKGANIEVVDTSGKVVGKGVTDSKAKAEAKAKTEAKANAKPASS